LSESRMQGDPHVRFDEQGVETGRLVSPTGEPHDTAPLPDSTLPLDYSLHDRSSIIFARAANDSNVKLDYPGSKRRRLGSQDMSSSRDF
jgi:hypothetical protein